MPSIEENLGRIATALEKIAANGGGGFIATLAEGLPVTIPLDGTKPIVAATPVVDKPNQTLADEAAKAASAKSLEDARKKVTADKAAADKAAADKAVADKAAADKATADKAAADKAAAEEKVTAGAESTGEKITLAMLQEKAAVLLAGGERRTLKSILDTHDAKSLSTAPDSVYPAIYKDLDEAVENMSLT